MKSGVLRPGDDEARSGGVPQAAHNPPTVTTEVVQRSTTGNIPHLAIVIVIVIMIMIMMRGSYLS